MKVPVTLRDSYDIDDVKTAIGKIRHRIYGRSRRRFRYFRDLGYETVNSIVCVEDSKDVEKTIANFVVTNKKVKFKNTLIVVHSPKLAFALIMRYCLDLSERGYIHPDVKIDNNSDINEGVVIYPGCVIERCHIGANTIVRANTYVCKDAYIGKDCEIGANCVVGANPMIYYSGVKHPSIGSVYIGDNVDIGASSVIDKGLLKDTIIDSDTIIPVCSHIICEQ